MWHLVQRAASYATNQTRTYCHIILHQSPGKIGQNIRFGSTITNRLYEGIGHKHKYGWIQNHIVILPGEWEGVWVVRHSCLTISYKLMKGGEALTKRLKRAF